MYAIIETGGKQVQVELGAKVRVEKIKGEIGGHHAFEHVLLIADSENSQIGTPYLENSTVIGKILNQGRDKKIRVIKMKRRKNYRRTQGHRQSFTELEVVQIGDVAAPAPMAAQPEPAAPQTDAAPADTAAAETHVASAAPMPAAESDEPPQKQPEGGGEGTKTED